MSKVAHLKNAATGECEPSCFGCKVESVSFAPSAMPTRHPNAARAAVKDPQLDKDREAYKRLRRNGEQPKHVGGSARLEAISESSAEITTGALMTEHGRDLLDTKARRREFAKVFEDQPTQPRVRTSPDEPSVLS
jgi:hypothetical protein